VRKATRSSTDRTRGPKREALNGVKSTPQWLAGPNLPVVSSQDPRRKEGDETNYPAVRKLRGLGWRCFRFRDPPRTEALPVKKGKAGKFLLFGCFHETT